MTVAFLVIIAITVAGTLGAVMFHNILHTIFGLATALLGVAGLFLLLGSPFVGAMEVLIYFGGISVAMIFAVMLSTVIGSCNLVPKSRRIAGFSVVTLFFGGMASVIATSSFETVETSEEAWEVYRIGEALLNEYNLAFESLSLLLLLAIIGAIVISSRETTETLLLNDRIAEQNDEPESKICHNENEVTS